MTSFLAFFLLTTQSLLLVETSGLNEECACHDDVFCSVQGNQHYVTFDGLIHHHQGACEYVLARDCFTEFWLLTVVNEAVFESASITAVKEVRLYVGLEKVVITNDTVSVDDEAVDPSTYLARGVRMHMEGRFVVVDTDFGLTFKYNQEHFVKVIISERWFNKVCGLCGSWNMDQEDDMYLLNAHDAHIAHLHGEEPCEAMQGPQNPCSHEQEEEKRRDACEDYLSETDCGLVSYEKKMDFCISDSCLCGEQCMCKHVQEYKDECYEATKNDKYLEDTCDGEEHIGSCTMPGYPHYYTFDNFHYTFYGANCWYVLAKDSCHDTWSIHILMEEKEDAATGIELSQVSITIEGSWVHIYRDLSIEDDTGMIPPLGTAKHSGPGYTISQSMGVVHVELDNGIDVYVGSGYIEVTANQRWIGKTCGLCGTWNVDVGDDGALTNANYAHTWAVNATHCNKTQIPSECDALVLEEAEKYCKDVMEYAKSVCPEIYADRYEDVCVTSYCTCGEECVCDVLITFFKECFIHTGKSEPLQMWEDKCERQKSEELCRAEGGMHYTTFDGYLYHFQGVCNYILVADWLDDTFQVIIEVTPDFDRARIVSVSKVTVIMEEETIVIDRIQVKRGGSPVVLPLSEEPLTIKRRGIGTQVTHSDMGITVNYDTKRTVTVTLDNRWMGKTFGLCGDMNGNQTEEEAMDADHHALHNSANYEGELCDFPPLPPRCQDPLEVNRATQLCTEELEQRNCHIVDYVDHMESCMVDVCACGEPCMCTHVASYVDRCFIATTEDGTIPYPCPQQDAPLNGFCIGMGDPHYQTFDNFRYDFQGDCWYVFAEDCAGTWEVQTKNVPVTENAKVSVIKWVKIRKDTTEISIPVKDRVIVDGYPVALDYDDDGLSIEEVEGGYLKIDLGNGVTVYHLNSYLRVEVDNSWMGSTCGLCGRWDMSQSDDSQLSDPAYANTMAVEGQSCPVPTNPECPEADLQKAKDACEPLRQLSSECSESLIEELMEYCVYDVCLCGEDCLCGIVEDIAIECAITQQNPNVTTSWTSYFEECTDIHEELESSSCSTWGDAHMITFDGFVHYFQAGVDYVFAEDCFSSLWKVIVHTEPYYHGALTGGVVGVIVDLGGKVIQMDQTGNKVNNEEVAIPYEKKSAFEIRYFGRGVILTTTFGFDVMFNKYYYVNVVVSESWLAKTCGMCGKWDADFKDEEELSEGKNSQSVIEGDGDYGNATIEDPMCRTEGIYNSAGRMCMTEIYPHKCEEIDYLKPVDFCISDLCSCGTMCMCINLIAYLEHCYAATEDETYLENPCDPSPGKGECSVIGNQQYTTFDAYEHNFQGECQYVFAADCVDDEWQVISRNVPVVTGGAVFYVGEAMILFDIYNITITQHAVMVDGVQITPPYEGDSGDFNITKDGSEVTVTTYLGVTVSYDMSSSLSVRISERWYNRTCGLCGVWNNLKTEEQEMDSDHEALQNMTLYDEGSCVHPQPPPQCSNEEEARLTCTDAFENYICDEVNPDQSIEACIQDVCTCAQQSCVCNHLKGYMQKCYSYTMDEKYDTDPCEDQGEGLSAYCSARGDPHYKTYDKVSYDFQGDCWYTLSKDCDGSWEVQTRNVHLGSNAAVTRVKEVKIIIGATTMLLQPYEDKISVDDETKNLPWTSTDDDYEVSLNHGVKHLDAIDAHGLEVTYHGTSVMVWVDSRWFAGTCGLCANWDMSTSDDDLLKDTEHANTMAVPGENCTAPEDVKPKEEDTEEAEELCKVLDKLSSHCPSTITDGFMKDCIFDVSLCGLGCLCDIVQDQATECSFLHGNFSLMDEWKDLVQVCLGHGTGVTASCSAWGDPHYATFDEYFHHFQGMCAYVFAADCDSDQWKVITENNPTFPRATVSSVSKVMFIMGDINIELDREIIKVNGDMVTVPVFEDMFTIFNVGRGVTVYTNIGVTVSYNLNRYVKVTVDQRWVNKTCGLCGIWNGDDSDEVAMDSDHALLQNKTLYGDNPCADPPPEPKCTTEADREEAEQICQRYLGKFPCEGVGYNTTLSFCTLDVCVCGEKCACDHALAYLEQCYHTNYIADYLEDSCSSDGIRGADCTIVGESFVVPYTGDFFSFLGECVFTLSRHCDGDWEVQILTKEKAGFTVSGRYYEVDSVNFIIKGTSANFKKDNTHTGEEETTLYESDVLTVLEKGRTMSAFILEGVVVYVRDHYARIRISDRWYGTTCGICDIYEGDSDANQDVSDYIVNPSDCTPMFPYDQCDTDTGQQKCNDALDYVSQNCTSLDVDPFITICTREWCRCGENCACDVIGGVADMCSPLWEDWRQDLDLCIIE